MIDLSDDLGENNGNIYLGDDQPIIGDVNVDGEVNVLDVVSLVGVILDGGDYTAACDVNGDGVLNVLDIVQLVNLILS